MERTRNPALAALVIALVLFGVSPVLLRSLLDGADPLGLLSLRWVAAALLFLPLALPARSWPRRDLWLAAGLGVVGIVGGSVPFTYGLQTVPAGTASLLLGTMPVWVALLAVVVGGERARGRLVVGLALSLAGVAALAGAPSTGGASTAAFLAGVALVLGSGVSFAVYLFGLAGLAARHGALSATAATTVLGALPMVVLARGGEVRLAAAFDMREWAVLALLVGGSSVLGMLLWSAGLRHRPTSHGALAITVVPLITVAAGALFLHEQLGPATAVSAVFCIAGVAIGCGVRLSPERQAT